MSLRFGSLRYLALFGLVVLTACDLNIFGPHAEYVNRRRLTEVPPQFAVWYAETEACLCQRGNYERVKWSIADSVYLVGAPRGAIISFPDDITIRADHMDSPWAIRHESAHHITQIGNELHDENGRVSCQNGTPS